MKHHLPPISTHSQRDEKNSPEGFEHPKPTLTSLLDSYPYFISWCDNQVTVMWLYPFQNGGIPVYKKELRGFFYTFKSIFLTISRAQLY